jgi:DNA-binding MarR family transcriptional regulator
MATLSKHRQNAMGSALGIDRTVLTYLVDRLEQAGLIERQPDPGDRRARLLHITDAGRVAQQRGAALLRKIDDDVVGELSEPDRRQLRTTLLGRLATASRTAGRPR